MKGRRLTRVSPLGPALWPLTNLQLVNWLGPLQHIHIPDIPHYSNPDQLPLLLLNAGVQLVEAGSHLRNLPQSNSTHLAWVQLSWKVHCGAEAPNSYSNLAASLSSHLARSCPFLGVPFPPSRREAAFSLLGDQVPS